MGIMVNGQWQIDEPVQGGDGSFKHQSSQVRHWITRDASPGPIGDDGFAPDEGRYHLYVSLACPFAHRTLIMLQLKELTQFVTVSIVNPYKGEQGWSFEPSELRNVDPLNNLDYLHEVYVLSNPNYSGRVSVPVLWDKLRGKIVSNDSGDIMRMFNSAFERAGAAAGDYYPVRLGAQIDQLNEELYEAINIGVYKAGFAHSQAVFDAAISSLFQCLDNLDIRLAKHRFLFGPNIVETDWRLFVTLIRFDAVYHTLFKCNLRRIVDYPNLAPYTRDLFQTGGVASSVDLNHIKRHYYQSMPSLNPSGLVPPGPDLDFHQPHTRSAIH